MSICKQVFALLLAAATFSAAAEIQVIDGVKYECKDGLCRIVDDEVPVEPAVSAATNVVVGRTVSRMTQGYMPAGKFVRWLEADDEPEDIWLTTPVGSASFWLGLLVILLGGLAMNLTPCVLPMIPINLLVIGKSAARGAWYGLGITVTYGALGLSAAVGGMAFGTIQGSPWFNLGVAIVFLVLALALSGVFVIDFSRFRPAVRQSENQTFFFPYFMGSLSAVLAGACVAPILISVLLLTGKMFAEGEKAALLLPFVFGLGMALPWPFLGAGMKVLPKPGKWMKGVNRLFALMVFGFAVWYGWLAWQGWTRDARQESAGDVLAATPETFEAVVASKSAKPILVDCWATWCKNCSAMERELKKPEVRRALEGFEVIRLQAEDMRALNALKGFEGVRGLPAFVIFR